MFVYSLYGTCICFVIIIVSTDADRYSVDVINVMMISSLSSQ